MKGPNLCFRDITLLATVREKLKTGRPVKRLFHGQGMTLASGSRSGEERTDSREFRFND